MTKTGHGRTAGRTASGLIFLTVPVYLYINLFAFPHIPFYLDGDQNYFREYALRLLSGERIYQDFFQFTPPGTDLFYLGLFRLFGPRIWVMNAAVLLLGSVLCWLCFCIARRLMEREAALLTTGLFLVLVYGRLLDATHHWFSLLALLCAVRIVMPGRTLLRVAAAGALFGVASFFTQTAGVAGAAALLLTLAWEGWRSRWSLFKLPWQATPGRALLMLAAFGLCAAALNARLLADVGWHRLWYFQITYPHYYLIFQQQGISARDFGWRRLPDLVERCFLYAALLAIYPLTLWGAIGGKIWGGRCEGQDDEEAAELVLLALLGLFLLLAIVTRSNWTRIYTVSMPGLILLMRAVTRRPAARRCVMIAGWVVVICLAAGQTWSRHRHNDRVAELPAGRAALSEQKYEKFSWLMQHTKPGDFLFQAGWLNVYPPLELRSPVFVDGLWANEVTRPEYVDLTIRQLEERQVKYILISPWLEAPENPKRPWEDHLGSFRAYVKDRYVFVRRFPDGDEIWERR
jgi:4-amino-4-deoxy-L-arabinose transferase-like glycosyltransferase